MRRALAAAAVWLLGGACAHVEPPPGGPEDRSPPALLVTRPDTLAVVPGWNAPAVLVFDERLSERGIQDAVQVSPRTSAVTVDHRGDELRVRLRGGWEPGMIYHVTVQPGIQDLFGNRLTQPVTLVFSTGPEIPPTAVGGEVIDRITGQPEVGIRVEAIRAADSLVYATATDSAGEYRIERIPEGEYQLRAFRDLNRNRALDDFEPRGTASAAVVSGDTVRGALAVLLPDSTPPVLAAAEVRDSITIELKFDDYLDPEQNLRPSKAQIIATRGGPVAVARLSVGALPAAAESPADTAEAARPSQSLFVELVPSSPLTPGAEYTVRVFGLTNLVGLSADIEAVVEVPAAAGGEEAPDAPAPPVPADTARSVALEPRRSGNT